MGGKLTSALSRETRDLLKENQTFYDSVIKLFDQTALKFKPSDSEAKTEVEMLQDGKLAIHVVIPIDANNSANDGRIYLRDTFIFDNKQKQLQEHKRSFEYNGRGDNKAEWQTWLDKYKAGPVPTGDTLAAFAAGAARSFSRPFTDKQFEIFKKLNNKKLKVGDQEKDNPDYLGFYEGLVGTANDNGLILRSRDPRSSYSIVHMGWVNKVVFTFAIVDKSGKPGNLLVKESFLLDSNTQALVGHSRKVEVAPEVANDAEWQQKAEAISAVAVPNVDAARTFIKNFLPDILTDAPEFKDAAPAPAPAGGYVNMDQAMFLKTMSAISRNQKAPAMSDMDPAYYTTLAKNEAYLAPLREALGKGFELNLKDPPLKTSVQVVNGKTQVFATYSLKPSNGEEGTLEYSERWTFQNGELTAIDRQAKALGAPQGGEVESAAQRIKESIQGGKFGDSKDKATWNAVVEQAAFLAPHLSYVGIPSLLQNPEAQGQISSSQMVVLPILQEIQGNLIPVLYQNDVDPKFRDDLLRMNEAFLHGDQQTLVASLSSLQKREEAAIKSAKDPQEKEVHEERMRIAEIVFTINTGDLEKAYGMSKQLVSPAYKKAFAKTLELPGKVNKVTEGLALISKVVEEQIDISAKSSKGLLSGGSQYSAADKDALQSLLSKSYFSLNKDMKTADPLKALQAAIDFGKNPEDVKDEQKKKLVLTDAEKALAQKILNDPIAEKISNICQEEDREIQAKEYFELARGTLFEKSLFQSSRFFVQNVVAVKMPKNGATESLDILRTYMLEKSENTAKTKTGALQQMPADTKAFGSFLKKLQTKAQDDPSKPIFTVLAELTDLSDDEKKLVERLKSSPAMQQVNQTAAKTSAKERFADYQAVIQPLMTDQLMIDDAIALLEKDPKVGIKKLLQNLAELDGTQDQYYPFLEQAQVVPEIEQKLAAAVTMPATERAAYYRTTLAQYFLNIPFANKAQENLGIMREYKDDTVQGQAIEGVGLAQIILAAQIDNEMRPQMKQAKEFARAATAQQKVIQSLLDKAQAAAPMHPEASAYTSLKELSDEALSPEEKDLRKQILEDKTISTILEIGAEPDIVKRKQAYLAQLPDMNTETPQPGALGKAGFPTTEMWLAQQVHLGKLPDVNGYVEMPMIKPGQQPDRRHFAAAAAMEHQAKMSRDVKKFLAMLEGKGDFGSKVGYGMPHFTHELTKPTSILAMAAAPLVGGASQVLVFNKLKNLGMLGKAVAIGVGVTAEAGTYTYLHAKGEKYAYGNDAPEKTYWNDLKTNVLLFGAMRGVHLGTAAFSENVIATGRLGKWGGGRVAGEAVGGNLQPLPTKQLAAIPSGGPGVPQLTVNGERLVSVLNHGGALASMYGAGQVAHWAGWQSKAPGLDDTFMMYLQAMAGYGITNAATGGRLNTGLADLNLRMGNIGGAKSAEDLKLEITKLKAEKTELIGEKKGLNESARRPIDTKINKIDGRILELEGKIEKIENAKSGKEPKKDDSGLLRLFESKPEELVLSEPTNGDSIATHPIKSGEEIALDAHLLGHEGADIVIKANAKGKLELHNNQKAPEVDPDAATADPAPAAPEVLLNGKPVTDPVELAKGDVVSVGGKEVKIGLNSPSPFQAAMAKIPRAQQLSLARQIEKAKKISDLFKILRDSPYGGAGEVMAVAAEVLAGRASVESLPVELGLRAKVEALIEAQVKEWKKEGVDIGNDVLKDGALPAGASKTEGEYHTIRALLALKAGVEGSRTIFDLLQALGQTSLQTVGGVSIKKIFDSLGLESKRGLLEQVTKAETELREKIRLADSAIKREKKSWSKPDKDMIEHQQKNRDEMHEKAEGLKELVELLKAEVEAGDAANAAGGRSLPEIIKDLPREMGIRQKAQDAREQAQGDFVKGLPEKEKTEFLDLAKRYFGAGEIEFDQAQSFLRSVWDGGTWQGRMLFNRLNPKQLELAMKVYFGESGSRNLAPEQAFRLIDAMSQTKIEGGLQVVLSHGEGPTRLDLVRSKGEATAKDGQAILAQTPSSSGKDIALVREDLKALCDQATAAWKHQSGESTPKAPNQLSDSQLFFDAETRSYQTWVVHPRGMAKVRITLDAKGEVEAIQVKYAARPGQKEIGLTLPENFKAGEGDATVEINKQSVDYSALSKELPFELKGPSLSYRALQGATWLGDRMPRLPKFGGDKPADAAKAEPSKKSDAPKPDAKADAKSDGKADAKTDGKAEEKPATEPTAKADEVKVDADPKPKDPAKKGSFYSGAMTLLGKLPKLRFRQAEKAEPVDSATKPAKPTKPGKGSGKKAPAKTEGTRPTIPEGLQFPPSQIGSGDKGDTLATLEIGQSANQLMGEYHGLTHEGVGRKRNEDGIGMAYTNERDLVLTAVDGMGGHERGKEAAVTSLEVLNAEVQVNGDVSAAMIKAHDKVVSDLHPGASSGKPGASIGVVKIRRPDTANGPRTMEAYWGGDVRIMVLRTGADGKRRLIYQNAEDNVARQMIDMGIANGNFSAEGRDLAIISNHMANQVNNVIGATSGGFTPRRTREGMLANAQGVLEPATGLERLELEKGDVVLVIPDGTSKNLKDPQVLIDLIAGKTKASDISRTIDGWVKGRMDLVNRVDQRYGNKEVPYDQRQEIVVDGETRHIDDSGNVYEKAQGGDPIDHYEADNFSAMVYVENPEPASTPKVEPKADVPAEPKSDLQTPSDTSLSDPDRTQVFLRPTDSDPK